MLKNKNQQTSEFQCFLTKRHGRGVILTCQRVYVTLFKNDHEWLARVAFEPVAYWEAQGFAGKRISNKIIFFCFFPNSGSSFRREMILLTGRFKEKLTWVTCNLRWRQQATISSHDVFFDVIKTIT